MNAIKSTLIENARQKGICADGFKELLQLSQKEELVGYYLANPDWCMERDFPDIDTLRRSFSDCEDLGVFVDHEFDGELFSGKQTYIFHNCRGTINIAMNYDKGVVPMLYFGNGCRIKVRCDQKKNLISPIRVPVYIFGKNDVSARNNRYATYTIYKSELI